MLFVLPARVGTTMQLTVLIYINIKYVCLFAFSLSSFYHMPDKTDDICEYFFFANYYFITIT